MTTNTLPRAAVFRLLSRTPEGLRSFADTAPRKDLIAYCVWNDPNGCYTDELGAVEGFEPIDLLDAWDAIQRVVDEAKQ